MHIEIQHLAVAAPVATKIQKYTPVRSCGRFKGSGEVGFGLRGIGIRQFANSVPRRVIAFNSDSPHLPASILEAAFEILATSDIVVGPTHDGGYYLVGAKANHPALFEDDGMGTGSAQEALLARARALQLSVGFTEACYDVDVAADLTRLAAELQLAPGRAPRTAAWLREWEQLTAHLPCGGGEL